MKKKKKKKKKFNVNVIYFPQIISTDKHCLKIAIYYTPILTRGEKNNYFLPRVKSEQ